MTDPTRLIDEASDDLENSLLQLARHEGPSAEGRRKILAGIAAASVTSLATQSAKAGRVAGKSMTAAKWSVLAVAAVAIPAAIWLRNSNDAAPVKAVPSALRAPATEVKPTAVAAPVVPQADGPAPVALEDLPTLPSLPSQTPASGSAPAPKQQGSLADEVAQLQKAKLSLKGGSPAQALAELGTYSQRFPRPMLGAEATVLRIEALSQSGDATRAKSLAEAFLTKNPNSPYAARLRSLTGAR
jgi:hypothetical protein